MLHPSLIPRHLCPWVASIHGEVVKNENQEEDRDYETGQSIRTGVN